MADFVESVHTPALSGDLEVQNMKKNKLDDGISRLVRICLLGRGNRQNIFVDMR